MHSLRSQDSQEGGHLRGAADAGDLDIGVDDVVPVAGGAGDRSPRVVVIICGAPLSHDEVGAGVVVRRDAEGAEDAGPRDGRTEDAVGKLTRQ